jgi:NADPH-dependent curcumin reductase CurA
LGVYLSDLAPARAVTAANRIDRGQNLPSGINRQWLLAQRPEALPEGLVGEEHFRWAESPIPRPAEGQFLVRNLWCSFDPTQWFLMTYFDPSNIESPGIPIGGPMRGLTVSQVVESRHPNFQPGDIVHGYSGWEDYSLTEGHGYFETTKVPPGVAPHLAIGTLGVTGMAAYFGVVEVGRPQPGETFVVSAAAGGVGSVAGQIAKILGARVIGIAGGKEKCAWLTGEGGFDAAIDHRTEDVGARLSALCPEGIDIYFDNVGGPILDLAIERLRSHGRVVLCGGTSRYGQKVIPRGLDNYLQLVMVNGRMEGLLARDYAPRFPEAAAAMLPWLRSGRLKSKEDVVIGLENAPKTFARLYTGANLGKQLLKIADPSPVGSPPAG